MPNSILDLEALLKVPHVENDGGFALSPDGSSLAFSWNRTGQWEIYMMRLDIKGQAHQITHGPGGKFVPRWSPDGSRLAYVLDLDGGENYDIFVYDPNTGRHSNLTPGTPEAIQPGYCWSPDGNRIAFASNRTGRFNTYVMPAGGGEAQLVLDLPHPDWEAHWSPDGEWLAVTLEAGGQDHETVLVPLAGGEPRQISAGGEPICARDACWSPQGQRMAFASNLHGFFQIGIYDLASQQIDWLPASEGDQETPDWSSDGSRIAFVIQHGAATSLAVVDLASRAMNEYQLAPGVHTHPKFTPDSSHLMLIFDDPRHPADIWRLDIVTGSFEQLTDSLPPELLNASFTTPEEIAYAGMDGERIPALLYRPADRLKEDESENLPAAVVYVHGGPNWLSRATWDPLVQHLVSRGWVVLAPNYRGSTGYGRAWQMANRFDLGGNDTQDIVAGADYLIRQRLADPARIAVTGRSYGGYLTMTSLTQYPDRWAAGSAVVPFLNWFTGHKNSREDLQHWDLENFGDPVKDHDLYYQRSPFFYLNRVNAPVQLISGANDPRCPASESIRAKEALDAQGKPCTLLLYPDEGHQFLKTANVIDAETRRAAFLAHALQRP